MKRKAIIVGGSGQDGRFLAEYLKRKEYELTLINRETLDITKLDDVNELVSRVKPHEIYFLPAYHHSSEDVLTSEGELFLKSFDIHVRAGANFLEAIACNVPTARFFYASSSHIFPPISKQPHTENTLPIPQSVYAITKYSGMLVCRYYREKKNIFASCGILFNHESNYRSPNYLSRKIVIAVTQIAHKKNDQLVLGNLDVSVDWGYAPDYVEAMYRMLQLNTPSDYVIATGILHTVREFVEIAFNYIGLDYRDYVKVQPDLLYKGPEIRVGDSTRLRLDTGWTPTVSFQEMVELMVDFEQNLT